jgi:hypothetical protein
MCIAVRVQPNTILWVKRLTSILSLWKASPLCSVILQPPVLIQRLFFIHLIQSVFYNGCSLFGKQITIPIAHEQYPYLAMRLSGNVDSGVPDGLLKQVSGPTFSITYSTIKTAQTRIVELVYPLLRYRLAFDIPPRSALYNIHPNNLSKGYNHE